MANIRLTKYFNFEAAHALFGYDGKCRNVHGHSYELYVTIVGPIINDPNHVKNGMVMDFGDLKEIVKSEIVDIFDHATILNQNSPHIKLAAQLREHMERVLLTDYQPTCENMLADFAQKIQRRLPDGIKLHSLKLHETPTSFAEWFAEDN
ncbi:6-pyruvoyl trahydropterin synthase family protein [Solitalea koreensis]|uniref:6-carboxy-5,6,7,8-tetrahydropterin synthase n=1 Tax=Solitalea koreensis TaxID=543615 RepID=A0A521BEV9_9SPHI|nr:6-carboxytetrahydropterin synthase [Solitalea koreensis]SMO45260.1 6-pyruvoyltetrahydropterin/6-carboxytetrahydropterin synthase [Solitalea koreensis]